MSDWLVERADGGVSAYTPQAYSSHAYLLIRGHLHSSCILPSWPGSPSLATYTKVAPLPSPSFGTLKLVGLQKRLPLQSPSLPRRPQEACCGSYETFCKAGLHLSQAQGDKGPSAVLVQRGSFELLPWGGQVPSSLLLTHWRRSESRGRQRRQPGHAWK